MAIETETADFHGRVLDANGAPVAGARVIQADLTSIYNNREEAVETDAEGRFVFERWPFIGQSGPLMIETPEGLTLTSAKPEIELAEQSEVVFQIKDQAGNPLTGVRVYPTALYSPGDHHLLLKRQQRDHAAKSDKNGLVTLTRLPKGFSVSIETDDRRFASIGTSLDYPIGLSQPFEQVLYPAGTIEGVLIGPAGISLEGIQVLAESHYPHHQQRSKTDKEGHFRISRLPPASYDIAVDIGPLAGDWVAQDLLGVAVHAGETVSNLSVTLSKGRQISGRVLEKESGKPLALVGVWAQGSGCNPSRSRSAYSDAEGIYAIRVPPGSYTVQVMHLPDVRCFNPSKTAVRVEVTEEKDARANVEIPHDMLVPKDRILEGIVLDEAGNPVEGAEVLLGGTSFGSSIITDPAGRFRMYCTGCETYAYAVKDDRATPNPIPLEGLSSITLEVRNGAAAALEGIVNDEHGQPLKEVQVTHYTTGLRSQECFTDDGGRYRFEHLLPGQSCGLRFESKGYGLGETYGLEIRAGEKRQLDPFVLPRSNSFVAGCVIDDRQVPVEGASVHLEHELRAVLTDREGRFRLENVPNGLLRLEVECPFSDQRQWAESGRDDHVIKLLPNRRGHARSRGNDRESLIGTPGPELPFNRWLNTEPITAEKHIGKIVLTTMWYADDESDSEEILELQRQYERFRDAERVLVVCGAFTESADKVEKRSKELGLTFPIGIMVLDCSPLRGRRSLFSIAVVDRNGNYTCFPKSVREAGDRIIAMD